MIEFEWYVKRARIDLELLFRVENIKSDEDLIEYCKLKNMTIPKSKYFPDPELETTTTLEKLPAPVPEQKPKTTRRRRVKKEESKPKDEVKPKKTRRRTTKKKTTK